MTPTPGAGPDADLLSELLAMLILRGPSDAVTFDEEECAGLRRAFPKGFALLVIGGHDRASVSMRLVGSESEELVRAAYADLADGRLDALRKLFPLGEADG